MSDIIAIPVLHTIPTAMTSAERSGSATPTCVDNRDYAARISQCPLPDVELWSVQLDACAVATGLAADASTQAVRAAASHFAARALLAEKIGCDPSALKIAADRNGKPRLLDDSGVEFNISRSGAEGLVGIAIGRSIGVDLETIRPVPEMSALVALHFTAAEQHAFSQLVPTRRTQAFLTAWTRKEACVKAVGVGLRIDLMALDVGIDPASRDVMVECQGLRVVTTVASATSPGGSVFSVATCAAATV